VTLAIAILVYAGAGVAVICPWLMLRMRDEYQMMHFISPPASLSAILITAAIFMQRGLQPESFEAAFITIVLLLMNAVVTHATARAFRIRQVRERWRPGEGDAVPVLRTDEPIPAPSGRRR
jgi:multisubunit Na+/H+ antiporter MnhG subunit